MAVSAGVPGTVEAAAIKKGYRVGIQAGHWKNAELPTELKALYWSTGASAGGYDEWEINLDIAQRVATILEADGISVDLLPATVPQDYAADAFVAIHADGNDDATVSGYKVAPSLWDTDGRAQELSDDIAASYARDTSLQSDSALAISDDMTQYYAFNYGKYLHSIDARTPGVLVEAGYITNTSDRRYLTQSADSVARGIADGIVMYVHSLPADGSPS